MDQPFTVLDPAGDTGFGFVRILSTAARAGFLIPDIGYAEATIDPTGGDQFWTV